MIRTAGRILKSNDVKLEGQFHLDAAQTGSGLPKQQVAASSAPQVRILENHPEYAVIEVTCSCGTRMSLKCEYAGAAAQAPDDPQT
ncbi:MAG: hypothetical protein WBC05_22680 [Sedimentisphaerales bacterium]